MAAVSWSGRTVVVGVLVVLAVRALYLVRFGWDLGWGNVGYLAHARAIALGQRTADEEQPLTYFALVAARRAGLTAVAANEVVYLVAHTLLALGTFGVARFIWPAASRARQIAVLATVAVIPLVATQSGRSNLGVTFAAGLTAAALALAAFAASASRSAVGGRWFPGVALAGASLLAALGGLARYEALAACVSGALVLLVAGRSMPGVQAPRHAALALLVGAFGTVLAVLALRSAVKSDVIPPAKTYAYYTFFDGLPLLMFPHLPSTEYARYQASAELFGHFDENHGSLAMAMLRHPGYAFLRIVTKPVDLLAVLGWLYGLSPIGLIFAAVGARRWDPGPAGQRRRAWLLAAYLLPAGMLFIPQQNPAYYVSVAVPLILAVAIGAEQVASRLSPSKARVFGGATLLGGVALVVFAGKPSVTNSRVLNQGASYLESRCPSGCLTNALPQSLRDQAWVVTDAGAPLPAREHRTETVIYGRQPPVLVERYDFCARVDRARAAGFAGPVLFVEARLSAFVPFDRDFDPEVRFEGAVDKARLIEEHRISIGRDELIFYELPAGSSCARS